MQNARVPQQSSTKANQRAPIPCNPPSSFPQTSIFFEFAKFKRAIRADFTLTKIVALCSIENKIKMSILGRYRPERLSSLRLFIPPDKSPVKRVFHSSRLAALDPIIPSQSPAPMSPPTAPICDLDDSIVNTKENEQHSNIELPELAPLPKPSHAAFSELLQQKRDIILTELQWTDPKGDVAAKEIRTKTIKEFLKLAETDLAMLKGPDGETFVSAVERALFKGPPHIDERWVFSDDTQNVGWELPDSEDLYKIIGHLMQFSRRLKERYIRMLVKQLSRPDKESERALVVDLLVETYEMNSGYVSVIRDMCVTMMWMYMEGMTSPYVLQPCMMIVGKTLAVTEDMGALREMYLRRILPLMNSAHYHLFYGQFARVVEQFLKSDGTLALPTLKALLKRFPKTRSNKAAMMLTLATTVLAEVAKTSVKDFKANMRSVFSLFAKCTVSENAKVSTASVGIWRNIELEGPITDNARTIFLVVFPEIWKGETSWSHEIRTNVDFVRQSMNRIDTVVFQDLCRAQRLEEEFLDKMKVWATIARQAAHVDHALDLGQMLTSIQSVFTVSKNSGHVKASKSIATVGSLQPRLRVPISNRPAPVCRSGGY